MATNATAPAKPDIYLDHVRTLAEDRRYHQLPHYDNEQKKQIASLSFEEDEGFFLKLNPDHHATFLAETKIADAIHTYTLRNLVSTNIDHHKDGTAYEVGTVTWKYTYLDKCCYYKIVIPLTGYRFYELRDFYGAKGTKTLTLTIGECKLEISLEEEFEKAGNFLVITCNSYVTYPILWDRCKLLFEIFAIVSGTQHFHWFCFFHHTPAHDSIAGMMYQKWSSLRLNYFSCFGSMVGMIYRAQQCGFNNQGIEKLASMALNNKLLRQSIEIYNEALQSPPRLHCLSIAKIMACLSALIGEEGGLALQMEEAEIVRIKDIDNRWAKMLSRLNIFLTPEEKTAIVWAYTVSWRSDFGEVNISTEINYRRLETVLINILNTIYLKLMGHTGFMGDHTCSKENFVWDQGYPNFWKRKI